MELVDAILSDTNPPELPAAVVAEAELLKEFRSLPRKEAFEVLRQKVPELDNLATELASGRRKPNDDIPEILQRVLTQRGISKEEWTAHGIRQDVRILAYLRNLVEPMVGPDATVDDPVATSAIARSIAILSLQALIPPNDDGGAPSP